MEAAQKEDAHGAEEDQNNPVEVEDPREKPSSNADDSSAEEAESAVVDLALPEGQTAKSDVYFPAKELPSPFTRLKTDRKLSRSEPMMLRAVPEFGISRGRIFGGR